MKGKSATPESHLFDITEDATKPSQTNADIFHHFVAQILYLSKRSRPVIHMAVSFLCNWVRDTDTDYYRNI